MAALATNARALAVQLYETNQRSKGALIGEYWRLPLACRADWERRAERVLASRAVRQPNYAALGFGSADEACGRN